MSFRSSVLLVAALTIAPAVLTAQRVAADITVGHGPVSGRILIGDPYPLYHRDVIEVRHRRPYRPAYREVIVVREHRGHGWYRSRGFRAVRIWFDVDRGVYYHERPYRNYRGVREVVVYERDGRYYHEYDRPGRDWRGRDRDRRYDDRDYDRRDRWDRDDDR